jgi:hypothetical protein
MNAEHEELATLYVLDQLDAAERTAFEARLLREPALAALVRELESTLEHSVRALPPVTPPADLFARIETRIENSATASPSHAPATAPTAARVSRVDLRTPARFAALFRWGLAAVNAVSLATLAVQSLRRPAPLVVVVGLDAHGSTSAEFPLRQPAHDPDARFIQLASLAERFWMSPDQLPVKLPAASAGNSGYALFDPASQQGFIVIEQLPALAPAQCYHLWTVDAATGATHDAGVVPLTGSTRGLYSFSLASSPEGKPAQLKFFVTVEDIAAAPSRPRGQVVLGRAPF